MMKNPNYNFWNESAAPILCMAPMADVTDAAFRRIFAKYGKPTVTWTEFVSADGLFLRPLGDNSHSPKTRLQEIAYEHGIGCDHPLLADLIVHESERPVVAQVFSNNPDRMRRAAAFIKDLGYDGIDLNMGCPANAICKQGAGAAMIRDPQLASEVIAAAVEGARDMPVSVKTRIGFNTIEIESWIPHLLNQKPAALSVHFRTRKEMSKVPAHWEFAQTVKAMRDEISPTTRVIGNGDVTSRENALLRISESGIDGAMIGRGLFGNPWFFNENVSKESLPLETILSVMLEHVKLFDELLGGVKPFPLMRKTCSAYISGFHGASHIRERLVHTESVAEVEEIVREFLG